MRVAWAAGAEPVQKNRYNITVVSHHHHPTSPRHTPPRKTTAFSKIGTVVWHGVGRKGSVTNMIITHCERCVHDKVFPVRGFQRVGPPPLA